MDDTALISTRRLCAPLLLGLHAACSFSPVEADPHSASPIVITEGISTFYATAARLLNDEVPSDELWAELFGSPGYAQIDAEEGRSRWMPEWIELAYRPSQRARLEARLLQKDMIGMILLPNLALAIEKRALIEATVAALERPGMGREILKEVSQWLPEGVIESVEAPRLYLIVLDGDSKALSTGIVLDVVGLAMTGIDYTKLLIAHEFHHYYRIQLDTVELDVVPEDIRPVVRLMEQAETEGIADLIDKRDMVLAPQGLPADQLAHPGLEWMWRIYLSQLKAAPSHVAELSLLLEQIADDELDLARAERLEADAGRISARPLGVFIADAVERKLGRARVIASVGDPFALLLAYAEAASGDDALPNISQSACEVLVRLRSVYGGN